MHRIEDLISLFHDCFFTKYNTVLVRGTNEPLYLPASEERPHNTLVFAHGFFASALHECAHWLIAGEARRKQVDFGYWYEPDGRTAAQQQLFQVVEVKPQAIEWILSLAARFPFRVSLDNLSGEETDASAFKNSVYNQVRTYCKTGLPPRAECLRQALCRFYHSPTLLRIEDFELASL